MSPIVQSGLEQVTSVLVKQEEDGLRIITGWQTRNQYVILSAQGETLGFLVEKDEGFLGSLARFFLRDRRPFTIAWTDSTGALVGMLSRSFAWFFPKLVVTLANGSSVGYVEKSFAVFRNTHQLYNSTGVKFGQLVGTFWGGRTLGDVALGNQSYALQDLTGHETGAFIAREWNGVLNRLFTDKDTYHVTFGSQLTPEQKMVFLASAVSIDFESYESQEGPGNRFAFLSSLFSGFGNSSDWNDN